MGASHVVSAAGRSAVISDCTSHARQWYTVAVWTRARRQPLNSFRSRRHSLRYHPVLYWRFLVITSAKKVVFLLLFVRQDNSKCCQQILMKFIGRVQRVTGNKWLDFGDDRDHNVDLGIFKEIFFYCEIGTTERILLLTQELSTNSFEILSRAGISH